MELGAGKITTRASRPPGAWATVMAVICMEGRVNELSDGYAKRWMAQVIADTEAQRAKELGQREERARTEAKAARERLTPINERLSRLLATIPVELQREGLSLPSLQASLRGRWRGNAHPGEIGRALRRLGFERRRSWRGPGGFQALWYPTARIKKGVYGGEHSRPKSVADVW